MNQRILYAAMWVLALALAAAVHAEEKAAVSAHGTQASEQGGKPVKIPESLAAYKSVLKALGYGKFEDLGSDSGSAAAGGVVNFKLGGYTVQVTVNSINGKECKITYVIKDKGGRALGSDTRTLKPGEPVTVAVGDAANPFVVILSKN